MNDFKRGDLVYKDYSWTAIDGDDPKISGEPDSTMFNRHEGYEVLYLINKCMDTWGLTGVSKSQKLERLIREELPSDVRSQKNVQEWLKTHHNT